MFKDEKKKKLKTPLQKIWYFIWEDDSVLSWVVNIVIAFVLIKYLIYPGIGFLLGTTHPVVAVVSGSMEHKITGDERSKLTLCGNNFDEKKLVDFNFFWDTCGGFYLSYNITKDGFQKYI